MLSTQNETKVKTPNLPLYLLLSISMYLLFSTCKKDNLSRKSFPEICILDHFSSSSEATFYFTISDIESSDPIQNISFIYSTVGSSSSSVEVPINMGVNSFTVTGLLADTLYQGKIQVKTSATDDNNTFYSKGGEYEFMTTPVTLVIESLVINELQLKATVTARVENYDEVKDDIMFSNPQIKWRWNDDSMNSLNQDSFIISQGLDLGDDGKFKAELRYFNFDVNSYKASAMIDANSNTVISSETSFDPDSLDGDYWVNIGNLPAFDNTNNQELKDVFYHDGLKQNHLHISHNI